jgi:hypothetical protein
MNTALKFKVNKVIHVVEFDSTSLPLPLFPRMHLSEIERL